MANSLPRRTLPVNLYAQGCSFTEYICKIKIEAAAFRSCNRQGWPRKNGLHHRPLFSCSQSSEILLPPFYVSPNSYFRLDRLFESFQATPID